MDNKARGGKGKSVKDMTGTVALLGSQQQNWKGMFEERGYALSLGRGFVA